MGSIRGMLVDTGNKNTAGSNKLLRGMIKSLFDANVSGGVHTKFLFQPSTFFEKSWLMDYRGVVTVIEADFGPRVLLTTAAIA